MLHIGSGFVPKLGSSSIYLPLRFDMKSRHSQHYQQETNFQHIRHFRKGLGILAQ